MCNLASRRFPQIRTAFNILGPMLNPARAAYGLIGVYSAAVGPLMASSLQRLGLQKALVVHSFGLDELTPLGPSDVIEVWRLCDYMHFCCAWSVCQHQSLCVGWADACKNLAVRSHCSVETLLTSSVDSTPLISYHMSDPLHAKPQCPSSQNRSECMSWTLASRAARTQRSQKDPHLCYHHSVHRRGFACTFWLCGTKALREGNL